MNNKHKGFHYEKELPHQISAVNAVLSVFHHAIKNENGNGKNPTLTLSDNQYQDNIRQIQRDNDIDKTPDFSNVLDISMETGTGKTYTYTQTMYEMHRICGVYKFVIVVPTLSIKAGTEQFLKSDALREHFRLDFDGKYGQTEIELYVVESQKANKSKRTSPMPNEIVRFVQADNTDKIHVLLLNMGMVNSKTMKGEDDGNDGSMLLNDNFDKPFEAIASVCPILIIDEPHRFKKDKTTWQNINKLSPQYIFRYGATFDENYYNLIYRLSAIDAFNQDLVKGVVAHIEEIQGEKADKIRFIESDGTIATFVYKKKTFYLNKGESFYKIDEHISDLYLENLNKSTAVLSNGLELKKNDGINPFSYSNNVFDLMIRKAVRTHFENERMLLNRDDKIKPLMLFFIDDIAGYRDGDKISGSLKERFEKIVLAEAKKALETTEQGTAFYHSLQTVLNDVSATHGGYFSKDNSSDDEEIAQEISEILHDKQSLLSLDNPRRFIFSKWTLREGWDNPNVFGICKLRSSGSETSKLQEVGRGLRLPVNEYMSRVKDGDFKLHYFVDSSESDFVKSLTDEINQSGERETIYTTLSDELFEKIGTAYPDIKRRPLSNELYELGLIDDDDNLLDGAYEKLKHDYPNAFSKQVLKQGKITKSGEKSKNKVFMRVGKYDELKSLWEIINQKAILQYQISESQTLSFLKDFLIENQSKFTKTRVTIQTQTMVKTAGNLIGFKRDDGSINDDIFEPLVTLNYRTFLQRLAEKSYIKMQTLHQAFFDLKDSIDIAKFMNDDTIIFIVSGFNDYLLNYSMSKFEVGYQKISSQIHPTKLTNHQGKPLDEIEINQDWGVLDAQTMPLDSFLFDKVFFDSKIEQENMTDGEIKEIIVFTKIPKNAIKIPVAGGETYSPDFAYVIKMSDGNYLNLVVESKGVDNQDNLRQQERQKIKHAERWFNTMNDGGMIKVEFCTQFNGDMIKNIIKQALDGEQHRD